MNHVVFRVVSGIIANSRGIIEDKELVGAFGLGDCASWLKLCLILISYANFGAVFLKMTPK